MKKTVSNESSTGNKNKRLEKERKTSATLRTQNWRLRIKLKGTHFNIPSHDNAENSPGHQSGGPLNRPRRQCPALHVGDPLFSIT
jgi:hypothetical protein